MQHSMHCTAATQLGNKVQKLDTRKTKKLGVSYLGLLQLLGPQSAKPKHLLGKKKILLGFGALFFLPKRYLAFVPLESSHGEYP